MSDKNTYKSAKPDKFYYICNSINELTHQNCIIMLGRLGYLFICFLWLLQSTEVLAVSKDKKPILIICSYNPAAHQTSVTISDYMDEYSKLGGQRDIVIENMNCKSFSEAPLWSAMMTQILAKYQGEKHPAQIILLGQEAWAAYLSQRDEMQVKVPVMCSLASSNVVILPKDTVENLDCWMHESVDIFEDHLDIPELESGFINQYDIEGNISMIQAFYPKTKHIAFISDNTYGGVTMQALVQKEMKKFPDLDLILMDNVKARELTSLGTYVKKGKNGRDKIGVQQYYIDHPIQFAKSEIQKNGFLWRLERLLARV